jgi:hypothetical protein
MSKSKYRISIQRGVGMTGLTVECDPGYRDSAVAHAKELLAAMPESTFQGDGVSITTIPGFGPLGLRDLPDPDAA